MNIRQADLAGFDWGARTADIVAALWPQRVKSLGLGERVSDQQSSRLAKNRCTPRGQSCHGGISSILPPPRGEAGYRQNTHDFAKFIWHQASPQWQFSDATFCQNRPGA